MRPCSGHVVLLNCSHCPVITARSPLEAHQGTEIAVVPSQVLREEQPGVAHIAASGAGHQPALLRQLDAVIPDHPLHRRARRRRHRLRRHALPAQIELSSLRPVAAEHQDRYAEYPVRQQVGRYGTLRVRRATKFWPQVATSRQVHGRTPAEMLR